MQPIQVLTIKMLGNWKLKKEAKNNTNKICMSLVNFYKVEGLSVSFLIVQFAIVLLCPLFDNPLLISLEHGQNLFSNLPPYTLIGFGFRFAISGFKVGSTNSLQT